MKRLQLFTVALALATIWMTAGGQAFGCPFCSAVSQTLRQEMATMDAVAIAESTRDSIRDEVTGSVSFKVVSVLKGESLVKAGETVKAVYYGSVEPGRRFMLSGADPTKSNGPVCRSLKSARNTCRTSPSCPTIRWSD